MARKPSDRILLAKLVEKHDTLGRWPTKEEVSADSDLACITCYVWRFGSYDASKEAAWLQAGRLTDAEMQALEPRRQELLRLLAQEIYERNEGYGIRPVGWRVLKQMGGRPLLAEYARCCGGVDGARRMLDFPVIIPDREDLIEAIQRFYRKEGRVPTLADCEVGLLGYARTAFERLFGSWNKAIIAAGLTPNQDQPNRRETMRKRRLLEEQEVVA